jgi:ATP phosphoribosyltransferase regulatory subunit
LENYHSCQSAHALKKLIRLFGGYDIFREAESLNLPGPVQYLSEVYNLLAGKFNVSVDFGLVSPLDYYTGIMFHIYLPDMGTAVVSGGRYDSLLAQFGIDWQAAGFALDLDGLTDYMMPETVDSRSAYAK